MLRLVGRVDGYDFDGKPRRVMVFERNGRFSLALNSMRHDTSAWLDLEAEATAAFGLRDAEYKPV